MIDIIRIGISHISIFEQTKTEEQRQKTPAPFASSI
jgi:hypothetical protein